MMMLGRVLHGRCGCDGGGAWLTGARFGNCIGDGSPLLVLFFVFIAVARSRSAALHPGVPSPQLFHHPVVHHRRPGSSTHPTDSKAAFIPLF